MGMKNINIDIQFVKVYEEWRVKVITGDFQSATFFSDSAPSEDEGSAFNRAIGYAQEALNDARDRQTSQRAEDIVDSTLKPFLEGLDPS